MSVRKEVKIALFILLIVLFIPFSFSQITSMTTFDVSNDAPVITSVEIKSNILRIEIADSNGYEDMGDDGYVKIISANEVKEADFEKGEGIFAFYSYEFNETPEASGKITIEVSDGSNSISNSYSVKEISESKPALFSITGATVLEPGSDFNLKGIFAGIFNFLKGIFGK